MRAKTQQSKRLAHPEVGALEIEFSAFTVNGAPHQQLVVYQAEPTAVAALAGLRALAGLTPATRVAPARALSTG